MQHLDRDPEEPLHVLICGWKTRQFMCALCRELDRGRTQLPRGSHVSFFNEHPPETLEAVEDTVRCVLDQLLLLFSHKRTGQCKLCVLVW